MFSLRHKIIDQSHIMPETGMAFAIYALMWVTHIKVNKSNSQIIITSTDIHQTLTAFNIHNLNYTRIMKYKFSEHGNDLK